MSCPGYDSALATISQFSPVIEPEINTNNESNKMTTKK